MTVRSSISRVRRLSAAVLATVILGTTAVVVLGTTPASADTRYETVLVESNCRVVTDYAKVQTPEQAAAGTWTWKPTSRTVCDRVYSTRAYRHSHWYHAVCPALTAAGAATGGAATAAGQAVVGASAITCVFTYSHI